ncbi:uncharacterized protein [Euwallacea fornicatus]|uniref:uncharacterized protein n=1 Tax=Euwallacea fornicatus TaxID=995702 RepID=UPI00338FD687
MSLCKKSTNSKDKDRKLDKSTLSLRHSNTKTKSYNNDNELKPIPNDQIKSVTVLSKKNKDNKLTYSCHKDQTIENSKKHLPKVERKNNKSKKGGEIRRPKSTEENLDNTELVEKLESVFYSSRESGDSLLKEPKMLVQTTSKANIELRIIDEDRTSLNKTCTSTQPININIDLKQTPMAKIGLQPNTSRSKFKLKEQNGCFTQEGEIEKTTIRIKTNRDSDCHAKQEEKIMKCRPKNVDSSSTFSDSCEDGKSVCCKAIISHDEKTAINIDVDSQSLQGDENLKTNLSTRLSDFDYFESVFYGQRMISEKNYALRKNIKSLESPHIFWKKQIQMKIFDDWEKSNIPIELEISRWQRPSETCKRVPLLSIDNPNIEANITCTPYRPRSYSESPSPTIKNNLLNRRAMSLSDISQPLIYLPLNAPISSNETESYASKTAIGATNQGDYKQELVDLLDAAANDLLKKPLKSNEKRHDHNARSANDQFGKVPRSMDTGSPDSSKLQHPEIVRKSGSNELSKKSSDMKIFPRKRKKIMVLESSEDEKETRIDPTKKRRNKSVEKKKANASSNSSLSSRQRNFAAKKESKTGSKSHKFDAINFEIRHEKEKQISKGKTIKPMVKEKTTLCSSLSINVDNYEVTDCLEKSVKGRRTSTGEITNIKPAICGSSPNVEPQYKPSRIKYCGSTYAFESDIDGTFNNIQQKYKERFRDLFGEASDDDEMTPQLPKYTSSLKHEMVENVSKRSIVTAKLKSNSKKPTKGSIKGLKGETFNVIKSKPLKALLSSVSTKEKRKQNSEITTNRPHLEKTVHKRDRRPFAKSQTKTCAKKRLKSESQLNIIVKKKRSDEEQQVATQEISLFNGRTEEKEYYFAAKTCTSLTSKPSLHQTFKMLDKSVEEVNICDKPEKKNDSNVVHDLDHVMKIVPPISIIDLTIKENYGGELKMPVEDCFGGMLLEGKREILESTEEKGIITMYKAQENLTAAEDVEAISASICVGYSTNRTFKEETSSVQTTTLNQSESSQIGAQCNSTLFKVFVSRSGENVEASISVPALFKPNSDTLEISGNSALHQTQANGSCIQNAPEETGGTRVLPSFSSDSCSVARTQNIQGGDNNDTELRHLANKLVDNFGAPKSAVSSIENHFCPPRVPSIFPPKKKLTTLMSNNDRFSINGSSVAAAVCLKNSGTSSAIKEPQSRVCKIEVKSSEEPINSSIEDQTYSSQRSDVSTLSSMPPNAINRGKSATVRVNKASKEVIPAWISVDFTAESRMQTPETPAELTLSSTAEKSSATPVSVGSTAGEDRASALIKKEMFSATCDDDNGTVDTVNMSISSGDTAPATPISLNAALKETTSCNLLPTGIAQISSSIKKEPADFVSLDSHAPDSDNVIQQQCGGNIPGSTSSSSNFEVSLRNPSSPSMITNENLSIPKSTASNLICAYPLSALIQTTAHSISSIEGRERIPRPSVVSCDIPNSNCPPQHSAMPSLSNLNRTDTQESRFGADKSLSVSDETAEGSMMLSLNDRMRIAEILSRHLYFLAQLCNVQNVYVQTLIRAKFHKSYFKAEIAIFEAQTKTRLNSQSLQLCKELLLLNIGVSCDLNNIVSSIIRDITNNLATKDMPKPTSKALVCLLLRELLVPNGKSYAKIPLFNVMMQYCDDALERMYDNCTRSTPFTEQMRKTLIYQIQQYNLIIANSRVATHHGSTNSLLKSNVEKQSEKRIHKYRTNHNLKRSNVVQPLPAQNRGVVPQNFGFPGGANTNCSGYTPIYVPQFQSRMQRHVYPQWLNFGNRGIPQFHLNPNVATDYRNYVPSTSIQRSDTETSSLKPRENSSLDNQVIFSKVLGSSNVEPFAETRHIGPQNNPSPLESAGNNGIIKGVSPVSDPALSPVRTSIHWKKRAANAKEICKPCNITTQLVQANKAKVDNITKVFDEAGSWNQWKVPKTVEKESPTRDTSQNDPTTIKFTRGISKTITSNTENRVNKEKVYPHHAATEKFICSEKRTSATDELTFNFKKRKLHEVADFLVAQNLDQLTAAEESKPIALPKGITPSIKVDQKFPVVHIDNPISIGETSFNNTFTNSSTVRNHIETIDLTWIDDIDTAELQKDIDFVFVKQENEENSVVQDCSGTDEETTITIVHRMCLCGVIAKYNCACGDAWYCGENCQLKDWVSHEKVCHANEVPES